MIVGEQGILLAKAVDDLDAKIKEATRDLGVKKRVLDVLLPPGIKLDYFIALAPLADLKENPGQGKGIGRGNDHVQSRSGNKSQGVAQARRAPRVPCRVQGSSCPDPGNHFKGRRIKNTRARHKPYQRRDRGVVVQGHWIFEGQRLPALRTGYKRSGTRRGVPLRF